MRIISNFKDYYDINLRYMYDPSLVYVRKTEEMPPDARLMSMIRKSPYYIPYPNSHGIDLDSFIIGFCGKLYPFMGYQNEIDSKGDLVKFILERNDSLKRKLIDIDKPASKWIEFRGEYTTSSYENWKKHVEDADLTDLFIEIGAPIFKISRTGWRGISFEKNPKLDGFQSTKMPAIAYQELSMFLGCMLVSEKEPPVKISDDVLIAKHGFDEWSFRKKVK